MACALPFLDLFLHLWEFPFPLFFHLVHPVQATAAVSVSLTFVDITYKVTLKAKAQQEKIILNNMNGYIKPGTFVAIMGPSGRYHRSTAPSEGMQGVKTRGA